MQNFLEGFWKELNFNSVLILTLGYFQRFRKVQLDFEDLLIFRDVLNYPAT